MKYLYTIFAIMLLMACNLASPAAPSPSTPTLTFPTPIAVSEILSLSPIVRTTNDGTIVLEAQTTITVTWDGLPDGSVATFILGNFLADGGVTQIGQGTSATFVVPDRIEGEVSATAQLADGSTVSAISLPIVTENMISGDCQFLPPALGPGVNLYSEPDMNSTTTGSVIYDAEYVVLAIQDGLDDKGATYPFYQIQHIDSGETAWVPVNVGETLAGDCTMLPLP